MFKRKQTPVPPPVEPTEKEKRLTAQVVGLRRILDDLITGRISPEQARRARNIVDRDRVDAAISAWLADPLDR